MRGKDAIAVGRARTLRFSATRAESILWAQIRNRQLDGFKFVRQEPIGHYYADFGCRDRRLIEVDGGQHPDSISDRLRDAELGAPGYRVVRFWNNEIVNNIEGVLQNLLAELRR